MELLYKNTRLGVRVNAYSKGGSNMVFTIGGEYGCGSKEIALELAMLTGYKFCDDEIVKEAMKDFGIDTESDTFSYYDESTGTADIHLVSLQLV